MDNIAGLAEHMHVDVSSLTKTIIEYNTNADSGKKDRFDKSVFPTKFNIDETFYVARITPAIHYTMGGLKIDKHANVRQNDIIYK